MVLQILYYGLGGYFSEILKQEWTIRANKVEENEGLIPPMVYLC
jgi:hypothetical protein